MKFSEIRASDREKLNKYLQCDGEIMADRCFSTLYVWRNVFETKYCIEDDMLFFRSVNNGCVEYTMPLGFGDFKSAVKKILEDAKSAELPCKITDITTARKDDIFDIIGSICKGTYAPEIYPKRENFDYIYDSKSFIELSGKKLHSKRNFINRFKTEFDGRWEYRDIDFENDRTPIFEFLDKWCLDMDMQTAAIKREYTAIAEAFDRYNDIEIYGGLLLFDGKVIAFTLASPQNQDVMDTIFEKADANVKGSYQMIANEFAKRHCAEYKYINREEDMGIEGLRKAKLSYFPEFLTEKYEAICPSLR